MKPLIYQRVAECVNQLRRGGIFIGIQILIMPTRSLRISINMTHILEFVSFFFFNVSEILLLCVCTVM